MKPFYSIRLAAAVAISWASVSLSHDKNIDMLVLQPDGLHKAALASGGSYQTGGRSPPKYRMDSLKDLVAASPTIVIATVRNATAELKDEGRFISTNYQLNVKQVIKGEIDKSDLLEMPGGTYTFSDGSVASQIEPISKALRTGTTYVLFLKRWDDQQNHFRVVGAGQGIFEISFDDKHLLSYTYRQNDVLNDEAGAGKTAFLERVESFAKK